LARETRAEFGHGVNKEPVSMPALRAASQKRANAHVVGEYADQRGGRTLEVRKSKLLNKPRRMSPAAIALSVKFGLSDCFEAKNSHSLMAPAKSRPHGG
jgi:hypothetical protein